MTPISPLGPVQRALYGVLVNDATLVNFLARAPNGGPGISDQPQPNAKYPRVELGGFMALPTPCYGRGSAASWGWSVTGQVKILSTYAGEAEGQAILARIVSLLHFPASVPTVAGYADVECQVTLEPSYPETVNNVIVRHFPVIVRVDLYER